MIKAVTFDLWDTVFIDDSDEPKRKAAGRPSKYHERRLLIHRCLQKVESIEKQLVDTVYDTVDAAFRKVWHDQHVTWKVRERLEIIFKGLGRTIPEDDFQEIIRLHEEMELEFRPDFAAGVHDAIKNLHGKYRLGVISDAIFSPGRCLRQLLQDEGLLDYFDLFIFSDEFGYSKPEPSVYKAAWRGFGVAPSEILHIGDREHNDITGPKKAGMRCILCTVVLDRGSAQTQADAVLNDYAELPRLIEKMNQ